MLAHCATEPRSLDTIRPRRIFGIGDASPGADDAWAAHWRSRPRRKPPPSRSKPAAVVPGVYASSGIVRPPFRLFDPFSARLRRFQPTASLGPRSYPRCHGVQFRGAQILYHKSRCRDATGARRGSSPKPSTAAPRQHDSQLLMKFTACRLRLQVHRGLCYALQSCWAAGSSRAPPRLPPSAIFIASLACESSLNGASLPKRLLIERRSPLKHPSPKLQDSQQRKQTPSAHSAPLRYIGALRGCRGSRRGESRFLDAGDFAWVELH